MIPFGTTAHTLKVTLRDVKPAVWRRVAVQSETPLPKFAHMLEAAMGWEGHHLHMFDVGGILFGRADEDADYQIDERCATMKHLLPKLQSKLLWNYDFGDGWEHDVVVEAIESSQEGKRYPLCLEGKRACPPEDCGGVPGYGELLRVLADPDDDEHDHMVSWAPEGFDPAAFDIVAANRRMRAR